jgi:putative thiazole/oxazole-modified microcin (TOMM)-like peptide
MATPVAVPVEYRARFARLVAHAWSDPALAERYAAAPAEVLGDHGVTWPAGTPAPPLPPAPAEVAVDDLGGTAGAAMATIGTVSCPGACVGIGL